MNTENTDNNSSDEIAQDAAVDEQAKPAPVDDVPKNEVEAKPESRADAPAERLKAELLALFDSDSPVGDRKSQAAALVKTLLELSPAPGNSLANPEPSQKVERRLNFLPVRPKIEYRHEKMPTTPYESLKRPN